MSTDFENALTIVRVLDAPREKVWRACREPEALRHWWGLPNGATMVACTVDFRVRGALHFAVTHPDFGTLWFKCDYTEIVDGAYFAMVQHFSDEAGHKLDSAARPACTITIRLEDFDGKTKLTATQKDMASDVHTVDNYRQGWSESLDNLARSLSQ
jgi:uncharacterized protein YndB with AHSA1/START domain